MIWINCGTDPRACLKQKSKESLKLTEDDGRWLEIPVYFQLPGVMIPA